MERGESPFIENEERGRGGGKKEFVYCKSLENTSSCQWAFVKLKSLLPVVFNRMKHVVHH